MNKFLIVTLVLAAPLVVRAQDARMGDKSPKSNQKQAAQKKAQAAATQQKKGAATAAKQAVRGK